MSIEANLKKLQENQTIAQLFEKLSKAGPAVIFGGAIRDWIIGKSPRDIDVVLDCPDSKLSFALNSLGLYKPERNRFGGYFFKIDGVEFDIWNLDSTWAFKKDTKFIKHLKTLPQTVFFNMDAVIYYLDTGSVLDNGFSQAMESKTLDIVYEPNPFPFLCVSKALCHLTKYEMRPSNNLKRYIDEQIGRGYTQKSFTKYVEMKNIPLTYEEVIKRIDA